MTERVAPANPRVHGGVWLVVLALAAGGMCWDAVVRSRHVLEVGDGYGVAVDAPALAPGTPTGYAQGRRSMILPSGASDTFHWVMQTQEMIARGEWRLRRVEYDNAPHGREVHWAAPFHWWLAGLACADHAVSGRPIGLAVERATLCSGPVMLGLLLVGLGPLLLRKFSAGAAGLFTLGAVAYFPFYLDFEAGYADHHGLANTCGLLTVLFLVVGASRPAGEPVRRWFVASAVAGGVGLWISAATQAPVLLGVGVGVLAAGWLARGAATPPGWMSDPGLWRTWGRVGGGVSLAAYLLEYFPNHMGWRLEVNHPLYALAWAGAGDVLRVAVIALRSGIGATSRRELAVGAGAVALVAVLPITILLTSARTFVVADPFVWQVHSLHISEFQPLTRILGRGWSWGSAALCLPMLLLGPALWLAVRRATSAGVRAQLALALLPALLGWLMGWGQVRWLGLAFALTIPVVALYFRLVETGEIKFRWPAPAWLLAGGLIFLPGAINAGLATRAAADFTEQEIRSLAQRDVAHWLRLRAGDGRVVVAASPDTTTRMIYYGSVAGVDTLYWENVAGLKAAAELFGAPSAGAAREVAARLGVTHFVFFSWAAFEPTLARLHRGLPEDAAPPDTFATRLWGAPVPPPWLRPLPYKLPDHPALKGAVVRIWEVTADQTPAEVLAAAANNFLELDLTAEAGRLVPALARFEDDLTANVMLAGIASRQENAAEFSAAVARVLARLDRAGSLPLEAHVHLVVVLTVADRMELARDQLRACLGKADERSLRQLTSGTLADLVALSDALQVPFPSAATKQLADSLLPAARQK